VLEPRPNRAAIRACAVTGLGAVAALGLAACSSPTPASGATPNDPGGSPAGFRALPSCRSVLPAEVQDSLGLSVGAPSTQVNGTVNVCTYTGTGTTPSTVIVRFESAMTPASFAAAKAGFAQHQEPTTDVAGLGDAAYSSTIGSAQVQQNTVVVLKGSSELLVTAPAPVDRIELLARRLLPSI